MTSNGTSGKGCADFLKKSIITEDNSIIKTLPDAFYMASVFGTSNMVKKNKSRKRGSSGKGRGRGASVRKSTIVSDTFMDEYEDYSDGIDAEDDDVEREDFDFIIPDVDEIAPRDPTSTDDECAGEGNGAPRKIVLKNSEYVVTPYDPIASYLDAVRTRDPEYKVKGENKVITFEEHVSKKKRDDDSESMDEEEMAEMVKNAEIGRAPVVASFGLDVYGEADENDSGAMMYHAKKKRVRHGDIVPISELNIELKVMEQCINPTVKLILEQKKAYSDPIVQKEIQNIKDKQMDKIIEELVASME